MKIATWNIERPTLTSKRNHQIIECLEIIDADILILTESNEIVRFGQTYSYFHSSKLADNYYKEGERRVSIYSKYEAITEIATFRNDTSICIKFDTLHGDLAVYGTVIGIHGNRRKSFIDDLNLQLLDIERIGRTENLCIAGDLNLSFSDNYYYTKEGRDKLNRILKDQNLINLTAGIPQNIDHIILPGSLINDKKIRIETWNMDKKLSDHIGVALTLSSENISLI